MYFKCPNYIFMGICDFNSSNLSLEKHWEQLQTKVYKCRQNIFKVQKRTYALVMYFHVPYLCLYGYLGYQFLQSIPKLPLKHIRYNCRQKQTNVDTIFKVQKTISVLLQHLLCIFMCPIYVLMGIWDFNSSNLTLNYPWNILYYQEQQETKVDKCRQSIFKVQKTISRTTLHDELRVTNVEESVS